MGRLTHGSDDLSLKSVLVLEAVGEIAHTSFAITGNVWDLSDVVEHMSASKKQDGDQADGRPKIAVLQDWEKIRP